MVPIRLVKTAAKEDVPALVCLLSTLAGGQLLAVVTAWCLR